LHEWLRGLLELALPPVCADCGAAVLASAVLCARCDARLPRLPLDGCPRCQRPGTRGAECGACAGRASPLAACCAAVAYQGDVEVWIQRFKYPRRGWRGLDPAPLGVVRQLVSEVARAAPGPSPTSVVPVPLHPRRLRERGFNPAALLARCIARERGGRFDAGLLARVRDTPSQTGLDRRARRVNVRGAFRVREGLRPASVVWLVDDVVTTGSTLVECARALRRAGARRVVAICIARTPETREALACCACIPSRPANARALTPPRCRSAPGAGARDRRAS
jgi:ComF family protein